MKQIEIPGNNETHYPAGQGDRFQVFLCISTYFHVFPPLLPGTYIFIHLHRQAGYTLSSKPIFIIGTDIASLSMRLKHPDKIRKTVMAKAFECGGTDGRGWHHIYLLIKK